MCDMDAEKLIELVRERDELYDITNCKYSDTHHKDGVWREIAWKLHQPVSTCKRCWFNLRDSFRRSQKKQKETKDGADSKKHKKWKYDEQMSFLLEHFRERDPASNIEYIYDDHDAVESRDEEQVSFPNERLENENSVSGNVDVEGRRMVPDRNTLNSSRKRKAETDSSLLLKYLLENGMDEYHEPNRAETVDPIDGFMSGIGATLKTFPPYYQNIAKSKIFTLVSDMELQQILNPHAPISSP